jgi:oxygen-dependent protoporphyrinogen oxidase
LCIASIKKHTIILGAGITGLSTAHYLSLKNKDFIVLEKKNRVGGNIQSIQKNGFTFENGPNTVLLNNDSITSLIKAYDLWDVMSNPKESAENNRYVLLNSRLQLLPRNPLEFLKSPLLNWKQKLRLFKEPFVAKHNQNTSVAEFISKRFGEGILHQFVEPFVTGIYSGNPQNMSAKHTLKLIWEAEQEYGSVIKGMIKKERKAKAKMFNFPNGLSQLTDAMANKLSSQIQYDCTIKSIEKSGDGYIIKSTDDTFSCQKIISTLPAHALSNYISDENLKSELNAVEYVPVDVFHFGFNKNDIKNQSQGFGVLTKPSDNKHFLGVLFNSRIFSHVSPKDKELFTVIVGGSRQKELCKLEPIDLENIVVKELMDLMECEQTPIFSNHYKYKKGIPQYDMNHQSLVDTIENFEKNNPNFHILGNYYNGISVSDSILKANNFVKINY